MALSFSGDAAWPVPQDASAEHGVFFESHVGGGGDGSGSDGNDSDADSDYRELKADIAKLKASREAFLAQHWDVDHGGASGMAGGRGGRRGGGGGGGRGRGRRRGPRKAAEPPLEAKIRLNDASRLYVQGKYDEALDLLLAVVRDNAEIRGAWSLLASIYEDMGHRENTMLAKLFVAHLEPKKICYSGALRADRDHIEARLGKANVLLELGRNPTAVGQYLRVLQRRPYHLVAIRNLAEASYDSPRRAETVASAAAAYQTAMAHARSGGQLDGGDAFGWVDVVIYAELFAALGQHARAADALKNLARWMLGRADEVYWNHLCPGDDREWDRGDERRSLVPEFVPGLHPPEAYGPGLPLDLRAKLAVYRLRLGDEAEAMEHLSWLRPDDAAVAEAFQNFPHMMGELADQLGQTDRTQLALQYFELYRSLYADMGGGVDAEALVQQGKCYLAVDDDSAAEECFLAAIEADEDNIEARYELAKQYERVQDKEQAFILVTEALSLEARQPGHGHGHRAPGPGGEEEEEEAEEDEQEEERGGERAEGVLGRGERDRKDSEDDRRFIVDGRGQLVRRVRTYRKRTRDQIAALRSQIPKDMMPPRRRRPRRFGGATRRHEFERDVSTRLRQKYDLCQSLKERVERGDRQARAEWMAAAKELTDDFRSFRDFYPWEKYVAFLGCGRLLEDAAGPASAPGGAAPTYGETLAAFAKRLQYNLAPTEAEIPAVTVDRPDHRGIPFNDWLELFLEYAIGLAQSGRVQEAYAVCQSARDSLVYQAKDSLFLIHITWATCAIHAADEETCVAVARYFMRDTMFSTDSYRLYSAICRVCRAPSLWYSSGPSQKFIMRQIRIIDEMLRGPDRPVPADWPKPTGLDVCLLVTYSHILFVSGGYTSALNYLQRAAALDPANPMVQLSIGLAYIHWAMRRQAENRQYMITQGLNYVKRYFEPRAASAVPLERQEAHFNMGRTYHILGLQPLAAQHYRRVLDEQLPGPDDPEAFVVEAAYNLRTYYLTAGNEEAARHVTREWLVL